MIRYALRRLLVLPLMLVLAALVFALLPVAGVVQAIVALGVVGGRRSRWRALRLWVFAAVYCAGECLCVLACLLLWLASPVPRWCDEDRWRARHVQVLTWYLGLLMHAAERMIALRLTLECPRGETIAADRPVIVLGRHAGPGASLVLIRVLLRDRGRVPKIVLKEKLRLDPALVVERAETRPGQRTRMFPVAEPHLGQHRCVDPGTRRHGRSHAAEATCAGAVTSA